MVHGYGFTGNGIEVIFWFWILVGPVARAARTAVTFVVILYIDRVVIFGVRVAGLYIFQPSYGPISDEDCATNYTQSSTTEKDAYVEPPITYRHVRNPPAIFSSLIHCSIEKLR